MERVQLSAREYCAACVQKGRGAPARVSLHGWMYSIMAKTSFWNLVPLILPCHMAFACTEHQSRTKESWRGTACVTPRTR